MAPQCSRCSTSISSIAKFCPSCGTPVTPGGTARLPSGLILNSRYRIGSLLGKGGFGAVYQAYDQNLKRQCAVKENLEVGLQAQQQFEDEATILANLSHPNLPRVTDHFVIQNQGQYLVMDFVEGHDLDSILSKHGPLPVKDAVSLISQIADALTYLHSRKPPVIHRDIKPANIRVNSQGKAYLVDFGLVKLYQTSVLTNSGARGVTPGFSPSEQYGQGGTDARSDIYALGATLYALLSGEVPQESVSRAGRDKVVQAHQLNPNVPPGVSAVIARAIALHPGNRFQTANEFRAALSAAFTSPTPGGTVVAPSTAPPYQATGVAGAASTPISKPVLSGMAIGALVMGLILVFLVAVVGFVVIPNLLRTSTPEPTVIVVTATSERISEAIPTNTLLPVIATPKEETPLPGTATPEDDTPQPTSTVTASPTVTPVFRSDAETNGEWIAYAYGDVRGELDIYRMNIQTGQKQQLTAGKWLDESPTFSPDGRNLLYVGCRGECELYLLDLHIFTEKKITNLSVKVKFPDFCRDASKPWVVFEGRSSVNRNVWMLNLDTGEAQQLTFSDADSRPMWSPDCNRVVFGRATSDTDKDGQITTNDFLDIYILDLATLEASRLMNTVGQDEFNFAWSPDGEWIAFCRVSADTDGNRIINLNDRSDLFIIRPDGSGERALIQNHYSVFTPSWSPDGQSIAFSAYHSSEKQALWIYSLATDEFTRLTEIGPYYHPEWSP